MLNDNYYLYRHIRMDTNTPFYIGIGTKPKIIKGLKHEYKRAFDIYKEKRSLFWFNIYDKCDKKIKIEVLFEHSDYDLIKEKEKEFIKLYGRKDVNNGMLVNLTDGGEGVKGKIVSEKTKHLISKNNTGRRHTEETKKKISENNARHNKGVPVSEEMKKRISIAVRKHNLATVRKVKCIETGEIFNSQKEVAFKMFGLTNNTTLHKILSGNCSNMSYHGLHFCYVGEKEEIKNPPYFIKIYCKENDKIYNSVSNFCRDIFNNVKLKSSVCRAIKKGKMFRGYTLSKVI